MSDRYSLSALLCLDMNDLYLYISDDYYHYDDDGDDDDDTISTAFVTDSLIFYIEFLVVTISQHQPNCHDS